MTQAALPKERFAAALLATAQTYGETLSPQALAIWWRLFEQHDTREVIEALGAHLVDPVKGRFMPRPADIVARLQSNDGFVEPELAWAQCPLDEDSTAIVCAELLAARAAAMPLMPNRIQVRGAFIAAYRLEVERARREGRRAKWFVSVGHDPERRQAVVEKALEMGLISHQVAQQHCPQLTWSEPDPAGLARLRATLAGLLPALQGAA